MTKEVSYFFIILLLLYAFLGVLLLLFSYFKKRKEINYLSLSYLLRAVSFLAPSLFIIQTKRNIFMTTGVTAITCSGRPSSNFRYRPLCQKL